MSTLTHSAVSRLKWINLLFWLFFMILVIERIHLFLLLNLQHIDSDQPLMWLGAIDFSNGEFHAPRFYGQKYNTFLEGLLAVPFIKLGMPVYYAVPLITYLLAFTPFLFSAWFLYRKNKKPQALLVLITLLCLPSGYDIMVSIPRGFVTGIFFTTPFILSLHDPKRLSYIALNSFCAYLGYLVNPNSLLVSLPVLFYIFLHNYRSRSYYFYTIGSLLPGLVLDYAVNRFYKLHPDYVLHDFKNEFSFDLFKDALTHLNERFVHISFFVHGHAFILILVLLITGLLLYRGNKKAFYSFLLFLAFILVSFFSSKIANGITWVFYSFSRMYLGIPIVLFLFLSLLEWSERTAFIIALLPLLYVPVKESVLKKTIEKESDPKKWLLIHLNSLETTQELLRNYKAICGKNKVSDLVVIGEVFCKEELAYCGPALDPDYPSTFLSNGERRAWRIAEEEQRKPERFVIFSDDYNFHTHGFDSLYHFKISIIDGYGCYLIEENTRSIPDFLEAVHFPVNGKYKRKKAVN